jgi:hypothetical protein
MRIKLFEMFKTDDFYHEIENGEWLRSHDKRIVITNNVNLKIKNLFDDKFRYEISHSYKRGSFIRVMDEESIHSEVYELDTVRIFVDNDDWFYVMISKRGSNVITYYKCDQFEGLKKLLKDLNIICE